MSEMTSWRNRASLGVMKEESTSSGLVFVEVKPEEDARATTAWMEMAPVQALRWWNSIRRESLRGSMMSGL